MNLYSVVILVHVRLCNAVKPNKISSGKNEPWTAALNGKNNQVQFEIAGQKQT